MLTVLLITSALANEGAATVADHGIELISAKRDVSAFQAKVDELLPELGACAEHTGGLDYGKLTLSFMVDKKGHTANASLRSDYVLPAPLTKCVTSAVEELELGRGDVAVGKVIFTLR